MRDGRFPSLGSFFEVECHDISLGGFSFYLDREPDFDVVAVELGRPPQQLFLAAHRSAHVPRTDRDGAAPRRLPVPRTPFSARPLWSRTHQVVGTTTHWIEVQVADLPYHLHEDSAEIQELHHVERTSFAAD